MKRKQGRSKERGRAEGGMGGEKHRGGLLAALAQGPRLRSGGWKVEFDVFLERFGAEGVHRKPMAEADWLSLAKRVQLWSDEALAEALAAELAADAQTRRSLISGGRAGRGVLASAT